MAYKKIRYNRRYKNKTKKFNRYAYAKTDSKNQSKQIVRLNKKIDNVYKTLKQEPIRRSKSGQNTLSSAAVSVIPFDVLIGAGSSSLLEIFGGNYTKFIYFNFKFFFNSGDVDLTQGKTIRIVILQNRYGLDAAPVASDLFRDSSGIVSSFKQGINNNYKILLNKIYTISSDKDYLIKSYNYKKLIGYNKLAKSAGPPSKYGRGSIFVMFITTQATEFTIKWESNLGYVDQSTIFT